MPFGDLEEDTPVVGSTLLDIIKSAWEENKAANVRLATLRDPAYPQYALVCEVPTELEVTEDIEARAAKAAQEEGAPPESVIYSCMLLARFARKLSARGKMRGDDKTSVFADPAILEGLEVQRPWQAVRRLFTVPGGKYDDGVTNRLALKLLTEGGLTRTDGDIVEDPM